jgi:ATP-dependent DNA helicase RecQ
MPAHPAAKPLSEPDDAPLRRALREHWGYDEFRPLQLEAMRAVLANRDSVVVLPTGGGKSLCFQVPAVVKPGLAIIVSPLISLMKDQVDTLRECGIAAAAVNSSMSADERRKIADDIRAGTLRILYAAPERLCSDRMLDFLEQVPISLIAIDEAHCISAWGHDFRPEFRILGQLRSRFPGVAMHAYTATATQAVRDDIATQLHQRDPLMLVGTVPTWATTSNGKPESATRFARSCRDARGSRGSCMPSRGRRSIHSPQNCDPKATPRSPITRVCPIPSGCGTRRIF